MNTTPVPDVIIDEHLTRAKPEYIAVCLYILRFRKDKPNVEPSAEKIQKSLGIDGKTVTDALIYWTGAGFDFAQKQKDNNDVVRIENRPTYPVSDIEKANRDTEDIRYLFKMAERILGKTLTYNDMNLLMGFYDWLALPVPVIEVLLDYCVSNNKRSIRYMEKVAMDWADNGITDVDEAESYIKTFNNGYREIMKAMGQSRRDPNQKEIDFIKKWMREYLMPIELIVEACGIAILSTGGASFKYVNGIIEDWHIKGINTMEQVKEDEQAFQDSKKDAKNKSGKTRGTKRQKSKYADYETTEVDYAEWERIASEHTEKSVEGYDGSASIT